MHIRGISLEILLCRFPPLPLHFHLLVLPPGGHTIWHDGFLVQCHVVYASQPAKRTCVKANLISIVVNKHFDVLMHENKSSRTNEQNICLKIVINLLEFFQI